MNGPRHQLFSRAALTQDQDRRAGRRDRLDHAKDLSHLGRLPDDLLEATPLFKLLLQVVQLIDEAPTLGGLRHREDHHVGAVKGLGQKVVGACLHRGHRVIDGREAGHQDDLRGHSQRLDLGEGL